MAAKKMDLCIPLCQWGSVWGGVGRDSGPGTGLTLNIKSYRNLLNSSNWNCFSWDDLEYKGLEVLTLGLTLNNL